MMTNSAAGVDAMDGRYLHDDVRRVTLTDTDGTERVLVDPESFYKVQAERDRYRRAVSLINLWRHSPGRPLHVLDAHLAEVGLGREEARALVSIIEQVRAEAASA